MEKRVYNTYMAYDDPHKMFIPACTCLIIVLLLFGMEFSSNPVFMSRL